MAAVSNNQLEIVVRSATKTFFNGPAKSVTSFNDTGMFDILPQHANFVTIIKDKIIIDKKKSTQKEIKVDKGVLSIKSNRVDIYLGF